MRTEKRGLHLMITCSSGNTFVSAMLVPSMPFESFSLIPKLAKHCLQSKYYLNSECLLVSDT